MNTKRTLASRERIRRWRGTKELVFDLIEESTRVVERAHASVATQTARALAIGVPVTPLPGAVMALHDAIAAGTYQSIRTVSRGVEKLLDAGSALGGLVAERVVGDDPPRSSAQGRAPWLIDHVEGALNGFYGNYLSERRNELDLGMSLRHDGRILPAERAALARAFPDASGKLCVFVHGLSSTEWSWSVSAERFYGDPGVNFGALLQADLGFTPLYVRYNSGRHVSENGRLLSALLAELVAEYPLEVEEIVLVGHSMGGLVVRSAAHYGQSDGGPWVERLSRVFCIGSPQLGAPLEKGVNVLSSVLGAIDTPGTQVPAQLLNARSAGIKDLRFGYTVDEEWQGKDPDALLQDYRQNVPLVDGVGYTFLAATVSEDPAHPLGLLLGDLLVRPPSAAGHAPQHARRIPFHAGRVLGGLNHFHLANHPEVYRAIREGIEGAPAQGDGPEAMSRQVDS